MNIRKCLVVAIAVCGAAIVAMANTVTWKDDGAAGWVDNSDWQNKNNFVGEVAPVAGDTVVIPANKKVTVSGSALEFVSTLARISANYASSTIEFNVPSGSYTNNCALGFASGWWVEGTTRIGRYVKKGSGEMVLGKLGEWDNYGRFIVEEGVLRLPVEMPSASSVVDRYYHELAVSNNATLYVCPGSPDKTNDCYTRCRYLNLAGSLRCAYANGRQVRVVGSEGVSTIAATGCVYDKIIIKTTARINVYAETLGDGTDQTVAISAYGGGVIGFARWGAWQNANSSFGWNNIRFEGADNGVVGGIAYLGSGEAGSKPVFFTDSASGTHTIDGGPNGNLKISADFYGQEGKVTSVILDGPHTNACVFAIGNMDTGNRSYTITKRGSGTWVFPNDRSASVSNLPRRDVGNISLEEGTLKFESLFDQGVNSSLGPGTNNYVVGYYGNFAAAAAKRADYSIALGSTNGNLAVFDYVGTNHVYSEGRLAAIRGDVTIRNSATNAAGKVQNFRLQGIKSIAANAATITLDGIGEENVLANISDEGAGAISIVKTGTGNWTLAGSNVISGSVVAKGGRLVVNGYDAPYNWFKFVGKQQISGGWEMHFGKIGIFDADGTRISSIAPTVVRNNRIADHYDLATNAVTVCNVDYSYKYCNDDGSTPFTDVKVMNAFNEGGMDDWAAHGWHLVYFNKGWTRTQVVRDTPSTHFTMILRLPSRQAAAGSYDMSTSTGVGYHFCDWDLYGSNDGFTWNQLDSKSNYIPKSPDSSNNYYYWYAASNKTSVANYRVHTTGWKINGAPASSETMTIMNVGAANGAVLEAVGTVLANGIVVEAGATPGTVKGITFAANGAIRVAGEMAAGVLPVTFADAKNLANVANWLITVNGAEKLNWKTTVDLAAGTVKISPAGLTIFIK